MRITQIDVFIVAVPYIPAIRKYRPNEENTRGPIPIVRVQTDEGIVGWGEGRRGQDVAPLIPQYIGADPLTLNPATLDVPFNVAFYDLIGKILNVPAYRLMGAKYWDRVPVGYWSCHMTPEDTAKEAEIGAKRGFTTHKLKARPEDIVKTAELMTRAAGPNYGIIVDPNFTFVSLPASLKLARQLESYNIQCFEDPFPWANDLSQYHHFRQRTDIPLAPHVSNQRIDTPADTLALINAHAADMFNVSGTAAQMQSAAAIANAAGLPVWLQSFGLCLGIGGAYSVHLAATIPNASIPADILHFLREHDLLVDNPIGPENGHIAVPEAPGLSVEVDTAAIERYRVG